MLSSSCTPGTYGPILSLADNTEGNTGSTMIHGSCNAYPTRLNLQQLGTGDEETTLLRLLKRSMFQNTATWLYHVVQSSPMSPSNALSIDCWKLVHAVDNAQRRLWSLLEAFAELHSLRGYMTEIAAQNTCIRTNSVFDSVIQKDDTEHVAILEIFVSLSSAKARLLAVRGRHANLLNNFLLWVVCDWKRQGALRDDEDRWSRLRLYLRRLSVRLAEASLQLPHRLFLNGVQYTPEASGRLSRRGSYATVHHGQWRTSRLCNYMEVAVKDFHQYDPQSAGQPFMNEAHYVQAIMKETTLLSSLRHPNICPLLGVVRVVGGSSVALVLPWMQHGNVTEYLSTPGESKNRFHIAFQVACGLSYLHGENIVHCDLHPANILIDDNGCAQLTDFGLSNFTDSSPATASLSRTGATRYKAPEIHCAEEEEGLVIHTKASDVFSLGMLILHILSGSHPFDELKRPLAVRSQIMKGRLPDIDQTCPEIPHTVREVMRACWPLSPEARPSAAWVASCFQDMCPRARSDPRQDDCATMGLL